MQPTSGDACLAQARGDAPHILDEGMPLSLALRPLALLSLEGTRRGAKGACRPKEAWGVLVFFYGSIE